MEQEYIKQMAIHGASTALVSRFVLRLDWKKAALVGVAAIITPIVVNQIRARLIRPQIQTATTGVIQ